MQNRSRLPTLVNANTVFIPSRDLYIPSNANLVTRMNQLMQQCFQSDFMPCATYDKAACVSYTLLYVVGTIPSVVQMSDLLQWLNSRTSVIQSVLETILLKQSSLGPVQEIYNVCTAPEGRRKGYFSEMMKSLQEQSEGYKLWLGVKILDNPWPALITTYARSNFKLLGIEDKTPGGYKTPFDFFSMLYDPEDMEPGVPTETLNQAKRLYTSYIIDLNTCNQVIHISKNLAKYIFDTYINQEVEYAGALSLTDVLFPDGQYKSVLTYDTETEVKGHPSNFTVRPPDAYLNFHTHPNICYKKFGCYVGWPSSIDLAILLSNRTGYDLYGHIVFSVEGIYMLSLTPEFAYIFLQLPNTTRNILSCAVSKHFAKLEIWRSEASIRNPELVPDKFFEGKTGPTSKASVFEQYKAEFTKYSLETLFEDIPTLKGDASCPLQTVNVDTLAKDILKVLDANNVTSGLLSVPLIRQDFQTWDSFAKYKTDYIPWQLDVYSPGSENTCPAIDATIIT